MMGLACKEIAFSLASVAWSSPIVLGDETRRPAVLEAAFERRSAVSLRTARVDFAVDPLDGFGPMKRFYSWRCAGDQISQIDLGDEDGVVLHDESGKPSKLDVGRRAWGYVQFNGELWEYVDQSGLAQVFPLHATAISNVHDVRRWGIDPIAPGHDVELIAREHNYKFRYDVRYEEDLEVVSLVIPDGRVEWWIDASNDYRIVRTQSVLHGRLIGRVDYEYKEFDGVWFPATITLHRFGEPGLAPIVSTVLHAEFNRLDHPQQLTPEVIGVEPGVNVFPADPSIKTRGMWTGSQVVEPNEFFAMQRRGEVTFSPDLKRALLGRGAELGIGRAGEGLRGFPSNVSIEKLLEAPGSIFAQYTAEFVRTHKLTDDQSANAWRICRDAERQAGEMVSRLAPQLRAFDQKQAELGAGTDQQIAAEQVRLQSRLKELLKPLDELFEQRFKPRLSALLTRSQKKTAPWSR